jgi:hypothetical protein
MIPKKEGGYYTPRITKEGVKIVNTKSFEVSA